MRLNGGCGTPDDRLVPSADCRERQLFGNEFGMMNFGYAPIVLKNYFRWLKNHRRKKLTA
jgi:hypothetical protein